MLKKGREKTEIEKEIQMGKNVRMRGYIFFSKTGQKKHFLFLMHGHNQHENGVHVFFGILAHGRPVLVYVAMVPYFFFLELVIWYVCLSIYPTYES